LKVKNLKSDLYTLEKESEDLASHYKKGMVDLVNHPPHYNKGKYETIEVIDDAIDEAPTTQIGYSQGNVIKYILRMWHKDKALEDAKKAKWYLDKIINLLEKEGNK
tara:strand:+ start:1339 stop:1656 length:318 start_codon:yes stop_codon:yes gene_type:complete